MPSNKFAMLSGREVVRSETIIVISGQTLEIYPFLDDTEYKLNIVFVFEEIAEPKITSRIKDEVATISVRRPFREGDSFSTRKGLNFAEDDDYEYWITLAGTVMGSIEKYTIITHFNILREGKIV